MVVGPVSADYHHVRWGDETLNDCVDWMSVSLVGMSFQCLPSRGTI